MIKPIPGDMFYANIPFKDDPTKDKGRPVVILKDLGNDLFIIAPLYGKNKTGYSKGLWILRDSIDGKKMGLDKDSFIIVDKKYQWPSFGFGEYFGHCHLLDELLSKLDK